MRNSEEDTGLRARVEALEAMVVILAQHLSADPAARRDIDDLIAKEVQAFANNADPAGADALLALQVDLDVQLSLAT